MTVKEEWGMEKLRVIQKINSKIAEECPYQ